MKVIVTGATGRVGSAVLNRCIEHPEITSIVVLSRRELQTKNAKLTTIIQKEFLKYENDILEQLKGAQACIWALGSPTSGVEVHVGYTKAAMNAFLTSLVPQLEKGKPFRFVYTSGGAVPYLESNALFFLPGTWRKARADLDRDVLAVEKQNEGRWESFVVRPWAVVDEPPFISKIVSNSWLYRTELGAAMVDAALNGNQDRIIGNADLRAKGQAALGKQAKGSL